MLWYKQYLLSRSNPQTRTNIILFHFSFHGGYYRRRYHQRGYHHREMGTIQDTCSIFCVWGMSFSWSKCSLDFLCSYLTKRKLGTKTNSSYSEFEEIIFSRHCFVIFFFHCFLLIYTYGMFFMKQEASILLIMLMIALFFFQSFRKFCWGLKMNAIKFFSNSKIATTSFNTKFTVSNRLKNTRKISQM